MEDRILGIKVHPGDRLALMLKAGGTVLGSYIGQHLDVVELGQTPDDHVIQLSAVKADEIVCVKVLTPIESD